MIKRPSFGIGPHGDRPAPQAILGQRLDERADELAAALAGEELLDAGNGRLVMIGDGQIEPGEANLAVADAVKAKAANSVLVRFSETA